MSNRLAGLGSVLIGTLLAGCAGGPKPAAAAAAPPVAAAAVSGKPATASSTVPVNQDLVKRGYRVQVRRGEVLYCRPEAITGTRLTSKLCRSEAEIKADELRVQQALGPAGVRRTTGCPPGVSCN